MNKKHLIIAGIAALAIGGIWYIRKRLVKQKNDFIATPVEKVATPTVVVTPVAAVAPKG